MTEQAECATAFSPRCSLRTGFLLGARVSLRRQHRGSLVLPLPAGGDPPRSRLWAGRLTGHASAISTPDKRLHRKYLHDGCPSVTWDQKKQQCSCPVLRGDSAHHVQATFLVLWSPEFLQQTLEFIGKCWFPRVVIFFNPTCYCTEASRNPWLFLIDAHHKKFSGCRPNFRNTLGLIMWQPAAKIP